MNKTTSQLQSKISTGQPDLQFAMFAVILALFGLIMLLSCSSYESEKLTGSPHTFFLNQAGSLIISLMVMSIVSILSLRAWQKLAWIGIFFSIICLALVNFSSFGLQAGGSERWLRFGFLSFQPSEITKIAVLILMADGLSRYHWFSRPVLIRLLVCLIAAGLVLIQPDLGTSVLILAGMVFLLFAAGMNWLIVGATGVLGLLSLNFIIKHNPYQLQRFNGWLHPERDPLNTGYNLLQSYYAIGSGGIFGTGYGGSLQKLGYLPVSYADFIFAVICEELGVIGAVGVIGAFMYLLWRGFQISLSNPTLFGRLLGIGIVFSLTLQVVFNLAGSTGMLPVTGMPLPLISYGKTSLIVVGFMLGILLSLSRHRITPTNSTAL
ncbi:MAG: putative peptidoglycan glycosyltransferase FtsW [Candidatus Caenarcaniphilales bacterium]|nr:putative peptidoglycan glycosyltransferase FtsW [Candidatus Caenarcaniphilales bacterium]